MYVDLKYIHYCRIFFNISSIAKKVSGNIQSILKYLNLSWVKLFWKMNKKSVKLDAVCHLLKLEQHTVRNKLLTCLLPLPFYYPTLKTMNNTTQLTWKWIKSKHWLQNKFNSHSSVVSNLVSLLWYINTEKSHQQWSRYFKWSTKTI